MTIKTFADDAYLTSLTTEVVAVHADGEPAIVLKETICYALSGGQPGDTATAQCNGDSFRIIDTRFDADKKTILHFLDPNESIPQLNSGDQIKLELDWSRRHRLMRMHTAMHLLCAIIPYPVTGGGVGDAESRVEFDMQTSDFDKDDLSRQLNEFVAQDLLVETSWITDEELDQNPELVRTMSVQPPRGQGRIRMLNIGAGVDYQPCGGTHVKSTAEIGELRITKIKSKGKQNKRVNIALVNP